MRELNPSEIVRVLNHHKVRYVIIGGVAAEIHDLPVPATVDLDITPARDTKNLERLALAFDQLEAGLLSAESAGTWFPRTPVELWSQYDTLHLITIAGPVDIVFTPDGAPLGYENLHGDALDLALGDQSVRVVSVEQWAALKAASGRARDLEHLDAFFEARRRE